MPGLDLFEDEDAGSTVFRDVVMLALVGFVALVILMLPHIQPKGRAATAEATPPGNVIVEVRWPDDIDADVAWHPRAGHLTVTPLQRRLQ